MCKEYNHSIVKLDALEKIFQREKYYYGWILPKITRASMEEVQSAYWNASMVSLHTMVAYFPGDRAPRNLQSYVAVSDVISHNATAVYDILKKIIPIIKEDYPVTKKIHYLTDSLTSQYRNKTIFQVLVDHETDFGMQAQWNYLESGHGKGPCDGLGASVKRAADMAIKQGKATIQDGKDFYNWTTKESGSKVKFTYYSQQDYDEAKTILESKQKCQAVSGTFKLHAVVPVDSVSIAVRDILLLLNMHQRCPKRLSRLEGQQVNQAGK